ncbi:MAG: septal ring lytic transglycosylase RlpA family protein [Burkholderiales bacterium]|nr:septal ring lytic transglycosylase RlpA family protein [Burkholderiales bacterium]
MAKLRFTLISCFFLFTVPIAAHSSSKEKPDKKAGAHQPHKTQHGKASYYGRQFAGKKMADGTPMNPKENIAASRTLPLGTKAKVTNLENGKATEVEIRDRGPYVKGRIVDLSPKAAEQLDMKKDGVAPVTVTPIDRPRSAGGEEPAGAEGTGNPGVRKP